LLNVWLYVLTGYSLALWTEQAGFGLLAMVAVPLWAQIAVTVVVLDLTAFLQHVLLHRYRFLWRMHRTHHTDTVVDAATSFRFHPLEHLFRLITKAPVIVLFGLPPEGVLAAFAVVAVVNVATHVNVRVPVWLENGLSVLFITPGIHRLHHSDDETLGNGNFGTVFSFWDRLYGSYHGPDELTESTLFGLKGPDASPRDSFGNLLMDPFRPAGSDTAAARRE